MNQKEATYAAVVNVCGVCEGAYVPTREQRAQVNLILFQGFRSGAIDLKREFSDPELKDYVSGLQSNWLRKDTRLNGGGKYEPKSPGSRSSDPQLAAMRQLLSTKTDPGERSEIQAFIDRRTAELAPKIDATQIPEALRHLLK